MQMLRQVALLAALALPMMCLTTVAMNPILPATAFIPDGEPHVFEFNGEKRVFVYGSRDERVTAFCGDGHDVWSAPVTDLTKWTNHGEIFHVKQVADIGYGIVANQHFGAPDCAYNPVTKKYYFYTFLGAPYKMDGQAGPKPGAPNHVPGFEDFGPKCVMASSDSPAGPFVNPVMCDWPAANTMGTFDPAVLVDGQPDGSVRVYAYWGMRKGDRWAELDPSDMHTIIDGKTRKPDRNAWHKTLPEPEKATNSSLFEASSIRKVADGHYVFICSANERIPALTYFSSHSPEGPWTYGGRIIDNSIGWRGGNDHGSIVNANGNWYVFYHRATANDYNRQAMIEPIEVKIAGGRVVIPPVEMTSQGVETNGLDAFRRYNAGIACYRTNNAFIDGKARNPDGLNPVVGIDKPNTVIGYKFLNFGDKPVTEADQLQLWLNIQRLQNTAVSVQVALPKEANDPAKRVEITSFNLQDYVAADGSYHEMIVLPIPGLAGNARLTALGGLKGQLAFFLVFNNDGGELCRLKEFEFAKGDGPTPNPLREICLPDAANGLRVTARPAKARPGESVKLSIELPAGQELKSVRVTDDKGNAIKLNPNGAAPYAPKSFNFEMPAAAVAVKVNEGVAPH